MFLILLASTGIRAQTPISGVVNEYARVDSVIEEIVPGRDGAIVPGAGQIWDGSDQFEIALLIQMKGTTVHDRMNNPTEAFWGTVKVLNNTGIYCFMLVEKVVNDSVVYFSSTIREDFDFNQPDSVFTTQLIKVPFAQSFLLDGNLTAKAWDPVSKTGGVLALFAADKLDLNGFQIDLGGYGFLGGAATRALPGITDCGAQDKSFRQESEDNIAGMKGEGIVYDGYPYVRGGMFVLGAGGGGEGRWTGGAGGSNAAPGGRGGRQTTDFCGWPPEYFGRAGAINSTYFSNSYNRIFMGSGGGSSVPEPDLPASDGGNGGGIVIIITDTLAGEIAGSQVIASGESVTDTSWTGGGGGGAGGFIVLDVNNVSGNVILDVSGGDGGNTFDSVLDQIHGPGGAGSGGVVWHSGPSLLSGLTENKSNGNKGAHLPNDGAHNAGEGNPGIRISNLILPLRGFFFNFLSGTQDLCQDSTAAMIVGSYPKGDTLFLFSWQDSTAGSLPQLIAGADEKDYEPGILDETTWFRRIVTKTTPPIESDTSSWIQVTVFNRIGNNLIAPDDTVCMSKIPDNMGPLSGGPTGGDGSYSYKWYTHTDEESSWTEAAFRAGDGLDNNPGFISLALTDTTYFRRQVVSHVCTHFSDSLTIVVLPDIDNNEISGDDTVCQFTYAGALSGLNPSGGEPGQYLYQWQAGRDKATWINISGATDINYSPGRMDTITTYYQRLVFSGKENTCVSISTQQLTIGVDPKLRQNYIAPDTAVCAETPTNLIYPDSSILGGDGIYKYTFWSSTDSSSWIVARPGNTTAFFNPVSLDETTWYFRAVVSGACTDSSNTIKFHVDTVITSNSLLTSNDTLCQGSDFGGITGTVAIGSQTASYEWDRTTNEADWDMAFSTGKDLPLQPGLTDSTWYRRRAVSGVCEAISDPVVAVFVHETITGNEIRMDTVVTKDACIFLPKLVKGNNENLGLQGGTGNPADILYAWEKYDPAGFWNSAPAAGALSNDQADYYSEELTGLQYDFRRRVAWGKCSSISDSLSLIVKERPGGSITPSVADSLCYDGTNLSRIVVPVSFSSGQQPYSVYYRDGQSGSGMEIIGSGDFSVLRGTADSTLYTVMIDSIVDAYGCVDTMSLQNKGEKLGMVYFNKLPQLVQSAYSVCGELASIEVVEGLGWKRFWEPVDPAYSISQPGQPMTDILISGWTNDTLVFPLTWYQQNGVCEMNSVTTTVSFFQEPAALANAPLVEDTIYFRQFLQMNEDTVIAGIGTWVNWDWQLSGGSDPVTELHNNRAVFDLGGENLDVETSRSMTWRVRNGACPGDSVVYDLLRRDLKMWQAFSPNGDVFNEYLILDGLEFADKFTMKIFSRKMALVKTLTRDDVFVDPRTGMMNAIWDGKMENKEDAEDGTYFYMIEVEHAGQKYNYKNFLELIRAEVQ